MANQLPLLENLTKSDIKALMDACVNFDAKNILGPDYEEVISYGIPGLKLYWKTKKEFEKDIEFITSTKSIVEANKKLEVRWASAPEKAPEANRPTKEQREEAEKIRQERDTSQKKSVEDANAAVKAAVKKQQEIYSEQRQKAQKVEESLKNQKIYYKVESVPVEKKQEIENLKQQAKADPKKFIKDAANQFNGNPNLKNLSIDEARVISKQAAVTTYDVLTDNSPIVQTAIIGKITSNPELLEKLVPNLDDQQIFKDFASDLIEQKRAQFELTKQFIDLSKIDGHNSPDNINIEFSFTPKEGFEEFDVNQQIVSPSIENLNQQNVLLGDLKGFGEGEIKSQILLGVGNRLESYIATLPANSFLAKTYNSEIVQLGLSSIGIVEAAPFIAVEGSMLGKIVVGSGFGHVAGFIQAKTGINLGVKLAVKAGTETVVKAGTTAVVKTGFKAVFSKVTAALGSAGGPIGTVLAWLGGELLVKIAEKIPWDKVKKWSAAIIGGVAGLIALPFLGLGAAIGIGAGATAIAAGLGAGLGGATLAGVGSGIAGFFGALGGAFLGAVGTPILITFLAFPVVVALILFIINSGAYIVPPGSSTFANILNPYMEVTKVPTPPGPFQNTELPLNVEYKITITAKNDALKNIRLTYECGVVKKGPKVNCPPVNPAVPTTLADIPSGDTFSFTYKQEYSKGKFEDSLIIDTITVIADVSGQNGVKSSASAGVKIGNPPDNCPSIWPVGGTHMITQTPGGGYSHVGVEALDIGQLPIGWSVRATHTGIATLHTAGGYGNYVDITSNCGGRIISTRYAHLSGFSVPDGKEVQLGTEVGKSGYGGSGPHLHYEFLGGIQMVPPFIPKPIIRNCSSDTGGCGYIP